MGARVISNTKTTIISMLAAFQVATQVGWGLKVLGPARGKQTLGLWQRDDTILFILTQNKIPRQARVGQ